MVEARNVGFKLVRNSKLLTYFELLRLPNVFTALADVMMGFVVTQGMLEPRLVFVILAASSAFLYTAGMVLNDVYDIDQDAQERPSRPLPSGRISWGLARAIGWELLLVGAAFGWTASYLTGSLRPAGVATLLAVCVVLYNRVLKTTVLGPPTMGACRGLNVLLGMSVAQFAWDAGLVTVALGIGIYITGLTWFARREAAVSNRGDLTFGALLMTAGIGLLYLAPRFTPYLIEPPSWRSLWLLVGLLILWRVVRAILSPESRFIQAAVRHGIFALFMLDAGVSLAMVGNQATIWPIVILCLSLPALVLGRWIAST